MRLENQRFGWKRGFNVELDCSRRGTNTNEINISCLFLWDLPEISARYERAQKIFSGAKFSLNSDGIKVEQKVKGSGMAFAANTKYESKVSMPECQSRVKVEHDEQMLAFN